MSGSRSIEWLRVGHEEVAAFAAGAGAHLTGVIAVRGGRCGGGGAGESERAIYAVDHQS